VAIATKTQKRKTCLPTKRAIVLEFLSNLTRFNYWKWAEIIGILKMNWGPFQQKFENGM
jgi:hypothetical protein